jgi:hypothetical protein
VSGHTTPDMRIAGWSDPPATLAGALQEHAAAVRDLASAVREAAAELTTAREQASDYLHVISDEEGGS